MYTTLDDAIHQIENEAKHETNVEHILDEKKYAEDINLVKSPMRQRKQVVFTRFNNESNEFYKNFPSVEKMVNLYEMCPASNKSVIKIDDRISYNRSPVSDEGCHSSEDDDLQSKLSILKKDKVVRSSSSDSALGLDDDQDIILIDQQLTTRRLTLTVNDIPLRSALLPLPEPTTLPMCDGNNPLTVRSKTILEANVIEISSQNDERNLCSRRESSQSCLSDNGDENYRIRYVRTPSVVVSDYSDDTLCGITLEEIEYFRSIRRGSIDERGETENDISDISASSSCSNLNYCGSHISILDQNETGLRTPERKFSNCSSCSTLSGDEDDAFPIKLAEAIHRQKQKVSQLE